MPPKTFTFTITGIIPSKKNSHKIKIHRGRPYIGPSDEYRAWEAENAHDLEMLSMAEKTHFRWQKNLSIKYIFRQKLTQKGKASTKRWDLSNKIESINDMMVKAGMIDDDHHGIISSMSARVENVNITESEVDVTISL